MSEENSDYSFEAEGDEPEGDQVSYCYDNEYDNEDNGKNERMKQYEGKESNSLYSEDEENNFYEDEENNNYEYEDEENNDDDDDNYEEEDNVISPPQFESYLNNHSNDEIEYGSTNYEESDTELNEFVSNDINKEFLQKYFGVNDGDDDDEDEDEKYDVNNNESDDDDDEDNDIGSDLMAIVNDYNEVVQLINSPNKNEKSKELNEKVKDHITFPMNKKKPTPEKIEKKLKKNKNIYLENDNTDGYENDKPKNGPKNRRENKRKNKDNDNSNNITNKEKNSSILEDIDEKHRSYLGEVVNKRRQEEEEELNKQRRALEKRKKFKDALLEKALKSRNELELKEGDVAMPGFHRKTKSFDEQAMIAAAMKKRLDNLPENLTEEEKIKLEEEKIAYIAKIRRKFKQQQKILLQELSTKRKEAEIKHEQDELLKEKKKEKHRKKTLGLVESKYTSKDTNDIDDERDGNNIDNNLSIKSNTGAAGGGLSAIRSKIISSKTNAKDLEVEISPEMLEAKKIANQQRQLKMTSYLNSISEQKKKDELDKKKNEERLMKRKILLSERVRKESDERKLMILEDKVVTNNVIIKENKKNNYVPKEKKEPKYIVKKEIKDTSSDSNKENVNSIKCTPEMTEAMLLRNKLSRAKVLESIDSLSSSNVPVRDFADWKRKNSVPTDGNVFSMTGWYPCVKQALLDKGWHFNPDSTSPYFDLKWTLRSIDIAQESLQPWQLTNHFLKNVAITTKIGLLKSLKSLTWLADTSIDDVIPRGFDLSNPQETQAFIDDFRLQKAELLLKNIYFKVTGLEKPADSILVQEGSELIGDEWSTSETPREIDTKKVVMVNEAIFLICCTVLERYLKPEEDSFIDEPLELDENQNSNFALFSAFEWELISQYDIFSVNKLTSEPMEAIDKFLNLHNNDDERSELQKQKYLQKKQKSDQILRERMEESIAVMIPVTSALISRIHRILSRLIVSSPLQSKINGTGDTATNMWIVKPAAKSRGRGIATFVDIFKLLKYVEAGSGFSSQWIVQKYMENQLIIAQRKFDIRQWVVVVDWNPLTIYFFDECYVRFSADEYENADIDNMFAHLSNASINCNAANFKEVFIAENGVEIQELMWSHETFSNFVKYKAGDDLMSKKIQPRMKQIVEWSLMCASEMIEHRKNSWELYGFDFMIDNEFNAWLIEINSSPACDYSTKVTERYVQKALVELLAVVIDTRKWEASNKKTRGDKPDTGGWQCICRGPTMATPLAAFGTEMCLKGESLKKKIPVNKVQTNQINFQLKNQANIQANTIQKQPQPQPNQPRPPLDEKKIKPRPNVSVHSNVAKKTNDLSLNVDKIHTNSNEDNEIVGIQSPTNSQNTSLIKTSPIINKDIILDDSDDELNDSNDNNNNNNNNIVKAVPNIPMLSVIGNSNYNIIKPVQKGGSVRKSSPPKVIAVPVKVFNIEF